MKPAHWADDVASAFQEHSVVEAYQFRPPYPAATFALLADLVPHRPRRVLDVGCGTGFLAHALAQTFEQVDAVDISPAMIAEARIQSSKIPNLIKPINWQVGRIEDPTLDAVLNTPYDLITAGDSLHWFDWPVALPRLSARLKPDGLLAIIENSQRPPIWQTDLVAVLKAHTQQPWQTFPNVTAELVKLNLFEVHGVAVTRPEPFVQTIDDYIASFHGRASFSRERMASEAIAAFDQGVRDAVQQACGPVTHITLQLGSSVAWGRPLG